MEGMKEKDLSEHGFDLSIMVPEKDPNKGIRPAKFELDERGRLQVKAGKGFGMSILEGAPLQDMDAKKEDIKNMNQALETDFVKEEEGLLIYKHAIPGSEKEMFHFFLVHEVDGMDYVIESLAEGEFTEKQVKRMIESAKTLSPKKESA